MLSLLLVSLEQMLLNGGSWQVAWTLMLLEEPPWVSLGRAPDRLGLLQSFPRLADQSWSTTALAYMRELDVIASRRRELAPPRGRQPYHGNPDAGGGGDSLPPNPALPPGRGRGRGGGAGEGGGLEAPLDAEMTPYMWCRCVTRWVVRSGTRLAIFVKAALSNLPCGGASLMPTEYASPPTREGGSRGPVAPRAHCSVSSLGLCASRCSSLGCLRPEPRVLWGERAASQGCGPEAAHRVPPRSLAPAGRAAQFAGSRACYGTLWRPSWGCLALRPARAGSRSPRIKSGYRPLWPSPPWKDTGGHGSFSPSRRRSSRLPLGTAPFFRV